METILPTANDALRAVLSRSQADPDDVRVFLQNMKRAKMQRARVLQDERAAVLQEVTAYEQLISSLPQSKR